MVLEVLHGALMLLGGRPGVEGSEIPPLACLRIELARIEPVFSDASLRIILPSP
jgi:hypothetical protein